VLPHAAAQLRAMLNLEGVRPSTPDGPDGSIGWDEAGAPLLDEGHTLGTPEILFDKVDDDAIDDQLAKLQSADTSQSMSESMSDSTTDTPYAKPKDQITFDDFMQLDLRMGTVTTAEPVPDADKLLRLEVDLGYEERQVLAGIAEQMTPDEITGRSVVVVANLAPKEMFGLESQGMVLMAEDREGTLVPISADAEPGSVVR
jgi:methionyl-tRNA synthetase